MRESRPAFEILLLKVSTMTIVDQQLNAILWDGEHRVRHVAVVIVLVVIAAAIGVCLENITRLNRLFSIGVFLILFGLLRIALARIYFRGLSLLGIMFIVTGCVWILGLMWFR